MELVGEEGEWNALSGMYNSTDEADDFMAQFFSNCSIPNELPVMYSSYYNTNTSSGSNGIVFPSLSHESHQFGEPHQFSVMENVGEDKKPLTSSVEAYSNDLMEGDQEISSGSIGKNLPEISKKRLQVSGDVQRKRNVRAKKTEMIVSTEENNGGLNGQNSSSCSSEDDSNGSQEQNGVTCLSTSSKGRASHLPQSLYARKRRERINERLKILQNLIPSGTKVDISTMLEEAVEYVKFLQLQIKLLSSDDMWMYAPLAYNGMDIGLDKITIPNDGFEDKEEELRYIYL